MSWLDDRVIEDFIRQRDALLAAVKAYRSQHDGLLWWQNRPCKCTACDQARAAIALVKGTA